MKYKIITLMLATILFMSCGNKSADGGDANTTTNTEEPAEEPASADPMSDKGIGPVSSLTLEAIDEKLVADGKELFKGKCKACHKIEKRKVGPAMYGVTKRRSPEWIMNMILNPEEMVKENPIAKALLEEYLSPMADQSLTKGEARAILEYFRSEDTKELETTE